MGPLRRAAARGGRALMAAMAPVASTSNFVATGVGTQSWNVLRAARPRDGRPGGLHLRSPFAASMPSRGASSSVTPREAIAVGDEETAAPP